MDVWVLTERTVEPGCDFDNTLIRSVVEDPEPTIDELRRLYELMDDTINVERKLGEIVVTNESADTAFVSTWTFTQRTVGQDVLPDDSEFFCGDHPDD